MRNRTERILTQPATWLVLKLAVIFSVFSQIETIERFARPGMYALWIAVPAVWCMRNRGKLRIARFTQKYIIAFALFCLLCGLAGIHAKSHFSANYLRVLVAPLLVTVAGDLCAEEDDRLFQQIGRIYLVCALIFAFWVQRTYIPSYDFWLNSRIYLFQEKNSAGQVWVSAILISVLLVDKKNTARKVLTYIACGYLLIMVGICQCRTSLLGLAAAILLYAISRSKRKGRMILIIAAIAAALWLIPAARAFIRQALLLNKYAGADLNTFSSGRLVKYGNALRSFLSSPVIGVGKYYVDSSYLLILAESGVVGFIIIEWIWMTRIVQNYQYRGEGRNKTFLLMMTSFYIVESLLEGFPPFGPGVSSFMFWFFSSVLINRAHPERIPDTADPQTAPALCRR